MTEDVGSSFATVWNAVVSELNGEIATDSADTNGEQYVAPLTPQQRAWLNLVQPLQIVAGLVAFALLLATGMQWFVERFAASFGALTGA